MDFFVYYCLWTAETSNVFVIESHIQCFHVCVAEEGVAVSHLPDSAADVWRGSRRSSPPHSSSFPQTSGDGLTPSAGTSQSAKPPLQTLQSARSKIIPATGAETACGNGRKRPIRSHRCQTAAWHQDWDATDGTRTYTDHGDSEATETHRREAQNWVWEPGCQREQTRPEEGRADHTHQGFEKVQALRCKSDSYFEMSRVWRWKCGCADQMLLLLQFYIKLDHVALVKHHMHLLNDRISRSI